MSAVRDLLAHAQNPDNSPIILDGGMSNALDSLGLAVAGDPLWTARYTLDDAGLEMIKTVHSKYLQSGADVITTAHYQLSPKQLTARGLDRKQSESVYQSTMRVAVEARNEYTISSQQASDGSAIRPLVAASIGPYGAVLNDGSEYKGAYGISDDDLAAFHRERVAYMLSGLDTPSDYPDVFLIETIPCAYEAVIICHILKESAPNIPVWVSFSCQDAEKTCGGDVIPDTFEKVASLGNVAAVGANCTDPQFIPAILSQARSVTSKPLLCYPNGGAEWDAGAEAWVGDSGPEPDDFADQAMIWRKEGAVIIGGCCQTSFEHITAMKNALST